MNQSASRVLTFVIVVIFVVNPALSTNNFDALLQAWSVKNITLLTESSTTLATSDSGVGGIVKILGYKVALLGNSLIDTSGIDGGGQVYIDGVYYGWLNKFIVELQ